MIKGFPETWILNLIQPTLPLGFHQAFLAAPSSQVPSFGPPHHYHPWHVRTAAGDPAKNQLATNHALSKNLLPDRLMIASSVQTHPPTGGVPIISRA